MKNTRKTHENCILHWKKTSFDKMTIGLSTSSPTDNRKLIVILMNLGWSKWWTCSFKMMNTFVNMTNLRLSSGRWGWRTYICHFNGVKFLKGYLVNLLEHFVLLFFCLQIMFPQLFALLPILFLLPSCRNAHFYARKGLIQLKSPINNQSRQQGVSYLCTTLVNLVHSVI
jgi:hypothetical protein